MPAALIMGVYRFEDLRVWQSAKTQCDRVAVLTKRPDFRRDEGLSRQVNNASLSVMLNISEGFVRRRDREMLQFLRISAASIARMTRRFQQTLERPQER